MLLGWIDCRASEYVVCLLLNLLVPVQHLHLVLCRGLLDVAMFGFVPLLSSTSM
jgi:hypothetical protein